MYIYVLIYIHTYKSMYMCTGTYFHIYVYMYTCTYNYSHSQGAQADPREVGSTQQTKTLRHYHQNTPNHQNTIKNSWNFPKTPGQGQYPTADLTQWETPGL